MELKAMGPVTQELNSLISQE